MKKILWIDVMKGFGMICVVIGHIFEGDISRTMFIFHMPLFFYISGYLMKPSSNFKEYFIKKTKHLLIPYIAFLIPLYIIFRGIPNFDKSGILGFFSDLLIGGRMLSGALGVFWFITCLFLTQQLMNFLLIKLKSKQLFTVMFLMLIASYINSYIFSSFWLPWNANVVFAAAPIFYIGFVMNKIKFIFNEIWFFVFGIVIIILSYFFKDNVYDMKYTKYGIPFITLLSSVILVFSSIVISKKLAKLRLPKNILSEIGKASMVIMYLHQPIQLSIKFFLDINTTLLFCITILLSYLLYLALLKLSFTRALFLGSSYDLKRIIKVLLKK